MKKIVVCSRMRAAFPAWFLPCFAILVMIGGSSRVSAQALQGITGTVTDASGGVVPNATVTATNDATAVVKTATTNSAGSYQFTDLIPGSYTVKMESPGFQSSIHSGVTVDVGKVSTVDAVLQPGKTEQTVNVTENAVTLDTTQPALGTTIENKVVQ